MHSLVANREAEKNNSGLSDDPLPDFFFEPLLEPVAFPFPESRSVFLLADYLRAFFTALL
jgi:hypothetical protein